MAIRLLGPILRTSWKPLLALHLVQLMADQYFSYTTFLINQRGSEDVALIALSSALELLFSLLWSAFWLLTLAPRANALYDQRPPPSLPTSAIRNLTQLVIEEMRVLAAVLLRVPLLLFPALIEYIRLSLVPYVVVLDPSYSQGKIDALHASRRLTRRRWTLMGFVVLAALLLNALVPNMIQGDNQGWIWQNPFRVGVASLLTFFINLADGVFLFALYRTLSAAQAEPGEPNADFRLETNQEPRTRTDL